MVYPFFALANTSSMVPANRKALSGRSSHWPSRIMRKPRRVSFSGTYWPGIPVNCSATWKLWDKKRCTLRARLTVSLSSSLSQGERVGRGVFAIAHKCTHPLAAPAAAQFALQCVACHGCLFITVDDDERFVRARIVHFENEGVHNAFEQAAKVLAALWSASRDRNAQLQVAYGGACEELGELGLRVEQVVDGLVPSQSLPVISGVCT